MSTKTERDKYKQTAIGETFEWKGRTFEVKKATERDGISCSDCWFFETHQTIEDCFTLPYCEPQPREDHADTIFALVEETPKAAD